MGIRDHQISTGPPVIVVFELYWATRYFEVWVYGTTGYFNVGIQRGQKLYRRVNFSFFYFCPIWAALEIIHFWDSCHFWSFLIPFSSFFSSFFLGSALGATAFRYPHGVSQVILDPLEHTWSRSDRICREGRALKTPIGAVADRAQSLIPLTMLKYSHAPPSPSSHTSHTKPLPVFLLKSHS